MDTYAHIVTYDNFAGQLGRRKNSVYVDIAGAPAVTSEVHALLGGRLAASYAVGGTYLRQRPDPSEKPLSGPGPTRFSVGDREDDISQSSGMETVVGLERAAQAILAPWASPWMNVNRIVGLNNVGSVWQHIVAGGLNPLDVTVMTP